jgi:hypothetical protein
MKWDVMKLHKNPLPPNSSLKDIMERQIAEARISCQGRNQWVNSYYSSYTNFLKHCQKEIREYYGRPEVGGTEIQ